MTIPTQSTYTQNQKVKYIINGLEGTGTICGIATQLDPLVGTVWIVDLDELWEYYDYTCIAIGSNHLQPLEAE